MASLRDLVTGSDSCSGGGQGGAGPSNALGSLVDGLLGGAKATEHAQELPTLLPTHRPPGLHLQHPHHLDPALAASRDHQLQIPGLHRPPGVEADVERFLHMEREQGHGGPFPGAEQFREFEDIYRQQALPQHPAEQTARMQALHGTFSSFLHAGLAGQPPGFQGLMLPDCRLSVPEQCRVRDRTTIMARHIFADRGDEFADAQVDMLLHSLHINPQALPTDADHRGAAWEGIWHGHRPREPSALEAIAADGSFAAGAAAPAAAVAWANDFQAEQETHPWAAEFDSGSPWVQEYEAAHEAMMATGSARAVGEAEAMQHTRQLADTLSADKSSKFQNSKFLQFVSKMSRGELAVEGNGIVERSPPLGVGESWANEFGAEADTAAMERIWAGGESWPGVSSTTNHGTAESWVNAFSEDAEAGDYFDDWIEKFAQEGGPQPSAFGDDWLEEYQAQLSRLNVDDFPEGGREEYRFSESNPFMEDPDPLARGRELFRSGVLSEAALALEAAIRRDPQSVEAWRLLGTVHAENDDDKQAIAAMVRALEADPENLEVLLSLGVSHTNELDQQEALGHLSKWLMNHSMHGAMASSMVQPGSAPSLAETIHMFERAMEAAPGEAEVPSALGVLHNLSRDYSAAVEAFRRALEIQPNDYSLWNKLGATLANSSRSGEAIAAYRRALDLKPNYMRAWVNMGISYSNIADYPESAKYYIQALELNSSGTAVWNYLKTSLLCAGRSDLLPALENRDLGALRSALSV